MFSEADAFLNVIFDNPAGDTPRLVYADWLGEHGQANYARFIRLQCEAARKVRWTPEANQLWEEIGGVWHELMDEWWLWPSHLCHIDAIHFHRGLLCKEVIFDIEQFAHLGSRWWPWFPTPSCEFELEGDRMAEAAAIPTLHRVRHMRIRGDDEHNEYTAGSISTFLASPHFEKLQVLDLTAVLFFPHEVPTAIPAGILPGLRDLRVLLADWDSAEHNLTGLQPMTVGEVRKMLEARFDRVTIHIDER